MLQDVIDDALESLRLHDVRQVSDVRRHVCLIHVARRLRHGDANVARAGARAGARALSRDLRNGGEQRATHLFMQLAARDDAEVGRARQTRVTDFTRRLCVSLHVLFFRQTALQVQRWKSGNGRGVIEANLIIGFNLPYLIPEIERVNGKSRIKPLT